MGQLQYQIARQAQDTFAQRLAFRQWITVRQRRPPRTKRYNNVLLGTVAHGEPVGNRKRLCGRVTRDNSADAPNQMGITKW